MKSTNKYVLFAAKWRDGFLMNRHICNMILNQEPTVAYNLFSAAVRYALEAELPCFTEGQKDENIYWPLIEKYLDASSQNYWRKNHAKFQEGEDGTDTMSDTVSDTITADKDKDKDEDEDEEEEKEKEEEEEEEEAVTPLYPPKGGMCLHTETKSMRFDPPTVGDVTDYVKETGCTHVDPESFVSFYESKGWMVGKNMMRNWKASVRNWERTAQKGLQDRHAGDSGMVLQDNSESKFELTKKMQRNG